MNIYIDLTNLMKVDFVTGIQRVARETIIRLLKRKDLSLFLLECSPYPEKFTLLDNASFMDFFAYGKGSKKNISLPKTISIYDIPSGSVFFDIDSVWNTRLKRSFLLPILHASGVKIVTLLYDLIPITHPQYCHKNTVMNFMMYTGAVIEYADLVITSAKATQNALDDLCDRLGKPRKKCVVVPLGCDFAHNKSTDGIPSQNVTDIAKKGKYLLMVGTIEPRKNHTLLINALDSGLEINVVFAGRIGWNVENLEKCIRNHPMLGKRLFFAENCSDTDIDFLYKNAFMVAFPTYNEGFGLPIIEAFQRNTPVIASDIAVLREVAGDFADYFPLNDKDAFIRIVHGYLNNMDKYSLKKERLKNFKPYTWDESAEATAECFEMFKAKKQITVIPTVKQMVILTARNSDILQTLPFIENFMQFIKEIVVCCPTQNVSEIKQSYKGSLKLTFLTDDDVLNGNPLPSDHTVRNFFLRCCIMQSDVLDDVFIMSDDDYRPLFPIEENVFIKDGRYTAYYCYNLNEWKGTYNNDTSFDLSIFRTRDFLSANGYPTLQYSSHQPQIIERRIYLEMLSRYSDIQLKGLDEWSTYFNYAIFHYPEKFRKEVYVSMCWPQNASDWDLYVCPKQFLFENHYSALYGKDMIFDGFTETFQSTVISENVLKSSRFMKHLNGQVIAKNIVNCWQNEYFFRYGEIPSFTVFMSQENLSSAAPEYIQLKSDCWSRIDVAFQNEVHNFSSSLSVIFEFSDISGKTILQNNEIPVRPSDTDITIPVKTPPFGFTGFMTFRVLALDKSIEKAIKIPAIIIT